MKHIALTIAAFICCALVALSQPATEQVMAEGEPINDKPEPAAVEESDEYEADEDYSEEYYEPTYYEPTYANDYWYESDDDEAEADAKEWIAWRESGGSYEARNGQYIGRYQLSADKLDGDWSEEHQEEVADEYVAERYGSWQAAREFWKDNGWY